MRYVLFLLLTVLVTPAYGQVITGSVQANTGNHASTAYESYASGAARIIASKSMYLEQLGNYLINLEIARKQAIENQAMLLRERWKIQDEAKERRESQDNYIQIQNKRLDMLEAMHALKLREQALIAKGILSEKKPSFKFEGKEFKTYADFKMSKEWELMRTLKNVEQDLESLEAEQKLKNAIKFEVNRRMIMWQGSSSPIGFY